ncbi:MAG TPA: pitrilysin family protein [Gemmatimonadaceae bacterium]|nr:pitrilysin family protein [Gemmatimonadaceae bacterium]
MTLAVAAAMTVASLALPTGARGDATARVHDDGGRGAPPQREVAKLPAAARHHLVARESAVTHARAERAALALRPQLGDGLADSTTTSYDVVGVRVIQRRVTANDVVAANLYLLGGAQQVTEANAGIEPFLLEVSERGTRHYPGAKLRETMTRLGSVIVVEPGADWTMVGLRATTANFDSSWAVLADRVAAPTVDSAEVEFVRGQYASAVRQRRDSPDALVSYVADSVAFAGHPYAIETTGTEQSIAAITAADLRRYQREQMVTSRMLLVVVGNVDRARVERLVGRTLATLPRGAYHWSPPPTLAPRENGGGFVVLPRALPTNYILGYYNGPPASSPDYQALRIAAAALGGRLFAEVRSRRNLTYAVNAPFVERAVSAGGLYVTTVAPDTVIAIMRDEVGRLKRDLVDPDGLDRLVQQFITEYFLNNETNSDQATFLARAQLYQGDYRAADRFVDELRRVTPADVRRVARRYMTGVSFAYLGDPSRVTPARAGGF